MTHKWLEICQTNLMISQVLLTGFFYRDVYHEVPGKGSRKAFPEQESGVGEDPGKGSRKKVLGKGSRKD